MDLSNAEVFLLTWAITATLAAAWFAHQLRKHLIMGLMLTRSMLGIALGKVKVSMHEGQIKLEDVE